MRWSRREVVVLIAAAALLFARVQALVSAGHPMPYFVSPYCCHRSVEKLEFEELKGTFDLQSNGATRARVAFPV